MDSKIIRAGAGTGKTECLIREVYSLFKKFRDIKKRHPRLIVCTFTRKASQELKERLFEKAKQELKEMRAQGIDIKKFQTEKKNLLKEDFSSSLFLNYIQSSSLYISTIDGILNMFLKRYGHQIDLNPDFQLSHKESTEKLFDSLAEDFVFNKNFSLLEKIPYHFLKKLFLFYFRIRMKYGEVNFYDKDDFKQFNQERDMFLRENEEFKKNNFLWMELLDASQLKGLFKEDNTFQADEFVSVFKEFDRSARDFFSIFMERKKMESTLDVDDLLLFSMSLLREKPETALKFSEEWDYWLLDEYQDTSWIQEQIISRIAKNIFCVGDPMQSIYLFRGADPHVFKRKEQALEGKLKTLETNYRSSASLIHFYNDFFTEKEGFIKIYPPADKKINIDKPCAYFFTYEKTKKSENNYKAVALQTLCHYIRKLIAEGCSYSDIAILSSKNDDLVEIASYLRSQNLPLILHSSKKFSQKRIILDALFLLKFLNNPQDDTNLKALLRTPYFRLSDQELADSSSDHFDFCNDNKRVSFWSFIKEKFSDRVFVRSLDSFLKIQRSQGFVKGFERALMDSGFMDLSYFQDSTGSFESNLWKLLFLLNHKKVSTLEIFYSLLLEEDEEDSSKEAPPCGNSESLELMTIHKSKGLQFPHVIIMDFSIGRSSLRSGNSGENEFIYDTEKQKMVFSVPIGGRDNLKIKSYGHKVHIKNKEREELLEKNRLFYVAMTRSKQSLALFIPNSPPEKNSWLANVCFFREFSSLDNKKPLEEIYDEQNKKKLISWRLIESFYKKTDYSICICSSETVCRSKEIPQS